MAASGVRRLGGAARQSSTGPGRTADGTTNGTAVQLWECNGTGAQQWRVRSDGSVQNPQSGLCLDNPDASTTPGTRLNIRTCTGSAAQAWRFR